MRLHEEIGAVRREIDLPLDRDEAWELISDPRELETWLADEVGLDAVEVGEEGPITFRDGTARHACVEDVEPGRRVSLCWWGEDEDPTLVDLTLYDRPSGTRLTVVELPLRAVRTSGPQMAVLA